MEDTAYTLLSLGMRYWFLLLIVLTLTRAFFLMWQDRRDYHRTLRQLPDAGLIGEVVDLESGKSQPLPREGLIGSGRSCDIRLGGLQRREMEFVFRNGLGLKLIPLHRRHQSFLDGRLLEKSRIFPFLNRKDLWAQGDESPHEPEPLSEKDAYALHGTILEIKGRTLRFRLFAGLNLPQRMDMAPAAWEAPFTSPYDEPGPLNEFDAPTLPEGSLDLTWQYAPLPPELLGPPETEPESSPPRKPRRFRRGDEGSE